MNKVTSTLAVAAFLIGAAVGSFAQGSAPAAPTPSAGPDVNAKASDGNTALMGAVEKGDVGQANSLIATGADVHTTPTPLAQAVAPTAPLTYSMTTTQPASSDFSGFTRRRSAACVSDSSGSVPDYRSAFSIGAFIPTGVPSGLSGNVGFTLAYNDVLKAFGQNDLTGTIRYTYYNVSANISGVSASEDVNLIHLMFGYRFNLANRRFYIEPSLGYVVAAAGATASAGGNSATAFGTTSGFAYSIATGVNFSRGFAELQYLGGSDSSESGLTVSLGYRL